MKEVLLIEDDKQLAEMYAKKFQKSGLHTTVSKDGRSGLEQIKLADFDVVVLDIMLPGISGVEVLSMLKSDKKTVKIPVIVYTNSGDPDNKNKCLTYGADEYILKVDSTPESLTQTINKVVTEKKIEEI